MLRSVSMIVSEDNSNGGHAFKGSMITIDGGDYVIRYLTRPCLKNGGMTNGERFFRQSRQIFAGGLSPGKKI